MRPGPLTTGARTSSSGDHGGMSGASTSRSSGMGMNYNVSFCEVLDSLNTSLSKPQLGLTLVKFYLLRFEILR